jgi:hypothetical protein
VATVSKVAALDPPICEFRGESIVEDGQAKAGETLVADFG